MSGEAFTTILTVDARTDPTDPARGEYAPTGSQEPRFLEAFGDATRRHEAWAAVYVYAEQAIRLACDAINEQPLAGLTGDHATLRMQAARVLDAAADAVRILALDHAGDSAIVDGENDPRWRAAMDTVIAEAT